MRSNARTRYIFRAGFAVLAFVALAMLVLVPPGYMVGGADRSGLVHIVICTGHGPVETAIDLGRTSPTKNGQPSAPCALSAHASAPPLSAPPAIVSAWPLEPAPLALPASRSFIGRGVAAPPPARAPPVAL